MAKAKPPLAVQVGEIAAQLDRSAIARVLGAMVAKRLPQRARPTRDPVPNTTSVHDPRPEPSFPAPSRQQRGPMRRTRRTAPQGGWKRIVPLVDSARRSGLRSGSKRYRKLAFVLDQCDTHTIVRVKDIYGKVYDDTTGEALDMHDIHGMAERRHIKLEEEL